ncbi:MAG: hypothetical protein ACR2QK_04500 [Acidimicrobiales bacterium]
MASVTRAPRPPIGLTLILIAVVLVVGFIATQWVVGLILGIIRLIMILIGFYLIARVGLFLLRKGR